MCSLAIVSTACAALAQPRCRAARPRARAIAVAGGRARRARIAPAEEVLGVDVAEHERGVGDRRLRAAARRSRPGPARRRRSRGPTRSRPPASTQAIEPPPAPIVLARRRTDRPVMWPVNGSPSHVSRVNMSQPSRTRLTSKLVPPVSQTIALPSRLRAAYTRAGDRRHRRPGIAPSRSGRAATRSIGEHAAERGRHEQLAGEARRARRSVGDLVRGGAASAASATRRSRCDEARRYSRMIGLSRCESVYGTPGQLALEQLADAHARARG